MAKDDEIVANEAGGVQSVGALRFDLIPPEALEALSQVLDYGAGKYQPWNWTFIPESEHIQHAITHLVKALHGPEDEKFPHVWHALCRAAFAVRMHQDPEPHKDAKPGLKKDPEEIPFESFHHVTPLPDLYRCSICGNDMAERYMAGHRTYHSEREGALPYFTLTR